jgi:hypothetical protein
MSVEKREESESGTQESRRKYVSEGQVRKVKKIQM